MEWAEAADCIRQAPVLYGMAVANRRNDSTTGEVSQECGASATRWSLVLKARSRDATGQAALSDLCALYYQPVVSFLRRDGRDDDTARDLAHAFFEALLTRGVGEPDPARGRFRNYLLGALKHFLIVRRTAESTRKRGGDQARVEWDETHRVLAIPATLDTAFDRYWAIAVLAAAMKAIEAEHTRRPEVFRVLRP